MAIAKATVAGCPRTPSSRTRATVLLLLQAPHPRHAGAVPDARKNRLKAASPAKKRESVRLANLHEQCDEQSHWKTASSFGRDDLLVVSEVCRMAFHWINREYGGGQRDPQQANAGQAEEQSDAAPSEEIPF